MALLKFQQDTTYYIENSIILMKNNEFIKAIALLRVALKFEKDETSCESVDIQVLIAKCYNELEIYSMAIELLTRVLAKKIDIGADGYFELIRAYAMNNQIVQAAYYLKIAHDKNIVTADDDAAFLFPVEKLDFSDFDNTYYDSEVARNFECDMTNFDGLSLYDKSSKKATIEIAKTLYESCGDKTFAKQMFETIPQTSSSYRDACAGLTLVALDENKPSVALEYLEKAQLSRITYLCVKMIAHNMLNQIGKVEEYFKEILLYEFDSVENSNNISEVFFTLESVKRSDFIVSFAELVLDGILYENKAIYLLCMQAYYNVGNFTKAKMIAVKLTTLYPEDFTIKFYARIVTDEIPVKNIELSQKIPQSEKGALCSLMRSAIKNAKDDSELDAKIASSYLYEDAMYCIVQSEYPIIYKADVLGKIARLHTCEAFTRNLLLEELPAIMQKECLLSLLQTCKDKHFVVKKNEVLKFYAPKKPFSPQLFNNAYWMVYTSLCQLEDKFDRVLNRAFSEVVTRLSSVEGLSATDNCIAAIIAYKSACSPLYKKKSACCEIFGAKINEFNKYWAIIKVK